MPNFRNSHAEKVVEPLNAPKKKGLAVENDQETTPTKDFPPFEVLLAWLNYSYQQTGVWPTPPETNSNKEVKASELEADKKLWIVPPNLRPESLTEIKSSFCYVNSIYYKVASQLIEEKAIRPIQPDFYYGCQKTLALVLAWCNFPLFKNLKNKQDLWMTLATAHCAQELKMRIATFKECIEELKNAGLLECAQISSEIISSKELEQLKREITANPESSIYWSSRSLQNKTLIYKIPTELASNLELPAFNPFSLERPNIKNGNDQDLIGTSETVKSVEKLNLRSFPSVPCHDKLIHDVDSNSVNSFISNQSLPPLTNDQKAKLAFLIQQATFKGYCRADGRNVLDNQEALKFALKDSLTLEEIQQRYERVNELWLSGRCRKNPLGLLHWSLSQNSEVYTEPIFANSPESEKASLPRKKSARTFSKKSASASKVDYSKLAERYSLVADSSIQAEVLETVLPHTEAFLPTPNSEPLTKNDLQFFWQEVQAYDLAGRFKLSATDISCLKNSQLLPNPNLPNSFCLVLPSVLEQSQLTVATQNIIRLALRQKLGYSCTLLFSVAH